jgi:hypothetical protein
MGKKDAHCRVSAVEPSHRGPRAVWLFRERDPDTWQIHRNGAMSLQGTRYNRFHHVVSTGFLIAGAVAGIGLWAALFRSLATVPG